MVEPAGGKPVLRIYLLGRFCVWVGEQEIPAERWRLRRVRGLIKLLALAPHHRLQRDQVLDTFWPDSDLQAAGNNLHQTLHAARGVFGTAGSSCISLSEGVVQLGGAGQDVWVDVDAFEAAAKRVKGSASLEELQAALDLYTGDLLPEDRYEDWTVQRREALRQTWIGLLLEMANRCEESRQYERGIETLGRLLAADRSNEEAHSGLMRLYALAGQRQQALRQYQALRDALREELETEPGEGAQRLYEAIQSGTFPAKTEPVLPVFAPKQQHNLPAQLTSFIGREEQIAELERLVQTQRLVTVTGAGGVGKTRLALQVMERLAGEYQHGTWFVELAPLSDEARVPAVTAESMLIALQSTEQDVTQELVRALSQRHMLLVLDNCEHVIDAAAALCARLLQGCPNVRVLATSRTLLGIAGEKAYRCPSLSLPAGQRNVSVDVLEQSEAARLFADRVRVVRQEFTLSENNAQAVTHICRRLDGIPLAIELAAARARMLSVEQIEARLDNMFGLLTGGSRAALPRHQTLRALIEWSYDLLGPEERVVLERLSVFAGDWTLEGAEAVCAGPEDASGATWIEQEQILDLLGGLMDKSLIQFEPSETAEPRYRMLETVRQFARERLAARGEEGQTRDRHLAYYLSLAKQFEEHYWRAEGPAWTDRMEAEMGNVRLALARAMEARLEMGLELATALLYFWLMYTHFNEGVEWLERLLEAQQQRRDSLNTAGKAARARALTTLSIICWRPNVPDEVWERRKDTIRESLAILEEMGEGYRKDRAIARWIQSVFSGGGLKEYQEHREEFLALGELFWVEQCDENILSMISAREFEQARFYFEECVAILDELGMDSPAAKWTLLYFWGRIEVANQLFDQGIAHLKESIDCAEACRAYWYAAIFRNDLAHILLDHGMYEEVYRLAELIHAAAEALNDPSFFYGSLNLQGWVALSKGEYALATRAGEQVSEGFKNGNYQQKMAGIYLLFTVALSQENPSLARSYLSRMPQSQLFFYYGSTNYGSVNYGFLASLGRLAALEGQMEQAATLFGIREASPAVQFGRAYTDYLELISVVKAALGEEAYNAAWEAGHRMTEEEALAYAQAVYANDPNAQHDAPA